MYPDIYMTNMYTQAHIVLHKGSQLFISFSKRFMILQVLRPPHHLLLLN